MRALFTVALLGLLTACPAETPAGGEAGTAVVVSDPIAKAAVFAKALKADPSAEAKLLADAGMTAKEMDALLYEIALDAEKSKAFLAAR